MGLAELVQQGAPPSGRLKELQDLAIEMAEYYRKSFGNVIQGILASAELYLRDGLQQDFQDAYDWLAKVEEFYATIPFERLKGREEFTPLFEVRKLLPIFREKIDQSLKQKNPGALRHVGFYGIRIASVGRRYSERFIGLLREIRRLPGGENFEVPVRHLINDNVSNYPPTMPNLE